jgi:plasmid maintenance system killer protein
LRAAPDFATLLKWRSFGLPHGAALPGVHAIRVANDWEMMIAFKQEQEPVSVILSVDEVAKQGRAAQ